MEHQRQIGHIRGKEPSVLEGQFNTMNVRILRQFNFLSSPFRVTKRNFRFSARMFIQIDLFLKSINYPFFKSTNEVQINEKVHLRHPEYPSKTSGSSNILLYGQQLHLRRIIF